VAGAAEEADTGTGNLTEHVGGQQGGWCLSIPVTLPAPSTSLAFQSVQKLKFIPAFTKENTCFKTL
jgi:hypothetical protein